ncbi:MAG: M48 family metallopeptidase [Hellea sp.]|nr:M48 family metallopeptidase [Hellea sp.]
MALNLTQKSIFTHLWVILALIFAQVSAAHGQALIRDTEIEETIRDFSVPLIRAAGLDPASVDLYIVNDGSLNAFVTRGQNIFFHTGLILEAKTPNQLKGVIAHEAGHIAGGHLVRSDQGNRSAYGSMLIAAGVGLAAILAGEGEAGALVLGGAPQFGALEVLAYTRVNESAADQYAAQYLERTGQSGKGLISFFEKFRYQEVLSNAKRYPYFRSHPLSSARIDGLREVVDESPYTDELDSAEDVYKLEMVQAKIRGFLESPQLVFSRYPASDTSDQARIARAVAHYQSASLSSAMIELDYLIESSPDNPYFHELRGEILYKSGKGEEAINHYRMALELRPNSPLMQIALAQAYLETGDKEDTQEAIQLLKFALLKEPKNSAAWYYLSQGYGNLNEEALAKYAIAEQSFAMGDYQRALSFAQRAQQDLRRDIPQWRRSSDIIVISETQLAKGKDRNRRKY